MCQSAGIRGQQRACNLSSMYVQLLQPCCHITIQLPASCWQSGQKHGARAASKRQLASCINHIKQCL